MLAAAPRRTKRLFGYQQRGRDYEARRDAYLRQLDAYTDWGGRAADDEFIGIPGGGDDEDEADGEGDDEVIIPADPDDDEGV